MNNLTRNEFVKEIRGHQCPSNTTDNVNQKDNSSQSQRKQEEIYAYD